MDALVRVFYRYRNKIIAVVLGVIYTGAVVAATWCCIGRSHRQGPQPPQVTLQAEQKTAAKIDYTPKASPEDPDVEITVPKQTLKVSVNGHQQTIHKTDAERYVLDKNKMTYEQTSSTVLDLKIPTDTRRWTLGIGAGKNGAAAMLKFPVKKNIGGWIAGDKKNIVGGIAINF